VSYDLQAIEERLRAIDSHLEECRAAIAQMSEGDVSAADDLGAEVDAMAGEIAALKARVSVAPLQPEDSSGG
jgi:hypothetical protein